MHEEGQALISNAGYINLNIKYDRNLNVNHPMDPDDSEFGAHMNFYNETKGEFYRTDNVGNLIIYNSFSDYVLRDNKIQQFSFSKNITKHFQIGEAENLKE